MPQHQAQLCRSGACALLSLCLLPACATEVGQADSGATPRAEEAGRAALDGARSRGGPPVAVLSVTPEGAWVPGHRITAHIGQSDGSPATALCVSTSPRCAAWRPMADSVELLLARSSAPQQVRLWLRDASGAVSAPVSAVVRVDSSPPTGGRLSATPTTGGAELSWSGFTDAVSGIVGYRVVADAGRRTPNCSNTAKVVWEGTATSTTIRGFSSTNDLSLRVCAQDAAGLWGDGPRATLRPVGEAVAPVVTRFVIADDATYVREREVTLHSDVLDDSGISQLCSSETETDPARCSPWRAYSPTATHELSGGVGPKTVRAWFKDPHGNLSATAQDTVTFDRVDPEDGEPTVEVDGEDVVLTWSGYEDALSGVVGYIVVRADDVAPSTCAEGEEVARTADTSARISGLRLIRHGLRVCAIDAAGNVSDGEPVRVTLRPPVVAPVITRFGAARTACDRSPPAALTASGDAAITRMCLTEDPLGCDYWSPFSESPTLDLSSGLGVKRVYAWVRDAEGVESAAPVSLDIERITCAGELELSRTDLHLGPVCDGAEAELVLRNVGNIPMTVTRITSSSPDFTPDLSPPLPWVIAPEDEATLSLAVGPGAGELTIETDAPGARRVLVPLSATIDLPPSVHFTAPADAAVLTAGATTTISAVVSDAEEDPRSLQALIESDVDGVLWEGSPDGSGVVSLRWVGPYQTAGDHALQATVTDRCGQEATAALGVCQDAGFTAENLDLTSWTFNGSARWDSANRWVELTPALRNQGGTAFQTATTVDSGDIDISFSFYMSGGTGADGISVTALDSSRMTRFVGGYGGGLGYSGLPGWSVEVDNYYNNGSDPTTDDHVSVHINGVVGRAEVWRALPDMEDGRWHTMRVRALGNRFTVVVDGTTYIDQNIAGLTNFPAYVGFTAATGGSTQNHRIDSLEVRGSACD
jgi:hypothetical protein